MIAGLEKVKDVSWKEVFDIWRQGEAGRQKWKKVWEGRGFESWEEWRLQYARPLRFPERKWTLYRVIDPRKTIPSFFGGPFRTWIERHYGGNPRPTMAELAQREDMRTNRDTMSLLNNYPEETTLIGLIQDDAAVIIEGMHRAVAIAVAAEQGKQFDTTIFIALADASGEELPVVGRTVKQQRK